MTQYITLYGLQNSQTIENILAASDADDDSHRPQHQHVATRQVISPPTLIGNKANDGIPQLIAPQLNPELRVRVTAFSLFSLPRVQLGITEVKNHWVPYRRYTEVLIVCVAVYLKGRVSWRSRFVRGPRHRVRAVMAAAATARCLTPGVPCPDAYRRWGLQQPHTGSCTI